MVGDGDMPVEPGIIEDSIMLPYDASWPPYIVAMKYSTIDSASGADNCTMDLVADSSLKRSNSRLRWSAGERKKRKTNIRSVAWKF